MSKSLIIAEKPSVAQDIVRALTPTAGKFEKHADHFENNRYVVTSAVGHLVEIKAPEAYDVKRGKWSFAHLPVVPPHFDLAPIDKAKSRLNAVVKLVRRKDVSELINACDAGREGELIFRLIVQYADGDGKKAVAGKPVRRLWLQSMTPQAIRDGFDALRSDAQMHGLADAARSRSEADWLVGINGTRAMTAFNSRDGGFFLTTVGRVQTPTLSVVVEREEKIRKHVPRDYWEVKASFLAQAGTYEGKWFDPLFKKNDDDPDARADRLWHEADARAIEQAVRGQSGSVSEESKPTTQSSPLLYDLTTLQREANGRFGFSAKTTLALAQSLYERHKALTYPRTDSRALPEDYLGVVKKTFAVLADGALPGPLRELGKHAGQALKADYVKPTKRVFDNAKVSDHFAIIPTLQTPTHLNEAEAKLYDLVAKRFIAVFYPPAEYLVTTRITSVGVHRFQTNGRVLVNPGWQAVYGKEASDDDANLVPVQPNETVRNVEIDALALKTRPPARYTEATLLSAMEGAGKLIEDDELRAAMHDKGLGTPATRAAIIEGLIFEKYMLREGRELIPTAKAFQLMTLLRGLDVEDLTKPELTGDWEHRLLEMEHGRLSRAAFMRDVASMAERIVRKAKEYDRDTIPGDYATLATPCPNCGGVVKENYRRFACTGPTGAGAGCEFSISKIPGGRSFEIAEAEAFLRDKRIGPLEGFRSKAGWPFSAELRLVHDDEIRNWKLEFDFGEDARRAQEDGEPVDFSGQTSIGACPKCKGHVYEHGTSYVCEHATGPNQTCDFKSGKIILQQPVAHEQMHKLLAGGRTDLLDGFVSNRTRRKFKAYLRYDSNEGKVVFEFEPRPQRGAKGAPPKGAKDDGDAAVRSDAAPATKAAKVAAKKPAAKKSATQTPARKSTVTKTATKTAATRTAATKTASKAATSPNDMAAAKQLRSVARKAR
ncbi:MAG: DNA topoisomerase III [Ideonella sp.]|nr:DNA topoisomerase III [Ideonella sp.]MCC7455329.1 DNA topoisomerase III [Nitrospira sp.]